MEKFEVGYWSIRGLGAPCRMMVMHAGKTLVAKNYVLKPKTEGEGWDISDWLVAKTEFRKQNPLINLPYVLHNGQLVTQTNAVMAYLGRKLDLWPNNETEASMAEQLLCEAMDIRNDLMIVYKKGDKETIETLLKNKSNAKRGNFQKLEDWLSTKQIQEYFVGSKPTSPDFHIWELLDQYKGVASYHSLDDPCETRFPHLEHFYNSFRAHPKNQNYFNSKLALLPYNNKTAKIGATPSKKPFVKNGQTPEWDLYSGVY